MPAARAAQPPGPSLLRIALLCVALTGSPAVAAELQVAVGAATDYVSHGLSRSRGDDVVQAVAGIARPDGSSAGVWFSTVDMNPGPGATLEFAPYVAHRLGLGPDLALDLQLSRYLYPNDLPALRYDYTDLRAALVWRDALELAVSASPDQSAYTSYGLERDRFAWRAELSGRYALTRSFGASAGIGFADLTRLTDSHSWYGNVGLDWRWRRLTASLAFIATDRRTRRLFGDDRAGDRVVGALVWRWR